MELHFSRAFVAASLLAAATVVVIARPADAATNTVVSFTFDDGTASHPATGAMLEAHGMRGTYYVNSGWVGSSDYYTTWPEIHGLAAAGHEIGGHTVNHTDLTSVSRTTAQHEACDDRQDLLARGFSPVASFAYPEAAWNATAEEVVQGCGYASARGVGGVSEDGCDDCPYAETIPPADAFALMTPQAADENTSLALLQSYVTQAETHGGGWVVLTFHGVCNDGCTDELSFSSTLFEDFLDWLQPRQADGTVVRTVAQAMGAETPAPGPPITSINCAGAACSNGWYGAGPLSIGLSTLDPDGSAVASTRYTTDGSDPVSSETAATYSGPFEVTGTTTVQYYSTDVDGHAEAVRSQLVRIDTAAPEVALTSPAQDASYQRGESVPLAATASDSDGSGLARVVFRDGTTTLRTDTTAPYSYSWRTRSTTRTGSHTFTAVATDAAGNTTTSAPVLVTITG